MDRLVNLIWSIIAILAFALFILVCNLDVSADAAAISIAIIIAGCMAYGSD